MRLTISQGVFDADDLTGKPPDERLNIRRISDQDGAKRYVKGILNEKEAKGDFDDVRTKSFEEQVEEASAITAEIADATGDSSLKNLDGVLKEKQEELVKALPALTAVRETMAEAARQASEIARKGSRMSQSEAVQLFALNQRLICSLKPPPTCSEQLQGSWDFNDTFQMSR